MRHFATFCHQSTRGPHMANPNMKLWVNAFWLKGERLCVTRCQNINFDRKKHVFELGATQTSKIMKCCSGPSLGAYCSKCPQVCCSFRSSVLGQPSANACVLVCCSSELSDRFSFPATLLDKFSPSCAFLTIPQSGHWRWSRNRSNRNPEYINVQCSAQLTAYFGGRVGVLQLEMFSLQAQGRLMHIVKRLMHIGLMYIWSLHCETVNAHCM